MIATRFGQHQITVLDFRGLRVTRFALALTAGVPLQLIQRATGHRTVEVVIKHDFRPVREDFRQVLLKAMLKMLGEGGGPSRTEEMGQIIEHLTPRSLKRDKERLLDLVAGL